MGFIDKMTKGFVIERIYPPENLPCPLFALHHMVFRALPKRGDSSLLQREGRRDLNLRSYRLFSNQPRTET